MSKQHVHKYRRVDIGRDLPYWVMQCSEAGCTYYIAMKTKKTAPHLVGKIAICNKCGDRFILDRRSLKLAKPICINCVQSPREEELKKVSKFFDNMEGMIEDDAG